MLKAGTEQVAATNEQVNVVAEQDVAIANIRSCCCF
jgi:hypothetical protein